jgi:hypothetical protein
MTGGWRDRAPDGIVPFVGYRAWQVVEEHGQPVFYPLSHRSREWVGASRGWASATCAVAGMPAAPPRTQLDWFDRPRPHSVPGEDCSCGFYAMKELHPHLVQLVSFAQKAQLDGRVPGRFILGRVELAGKVIEHDDGYRAERARIVELIPLRDSERDVEALARRVDVPVGSSVKPARIRLRDRMLAALTGFPRARPRREMSAAVLALWLLAIVTYAGAFIIDPAHPGSSPLRGIAFMCVIAQAVVGVFRARR